jgi:hypothetical protein
MALDLTKTAVHLYSASPRLIASRESQLQAIAAAVTLAAPADPNLIELRRVSGKSTWLVAGLDGALSGATPTPPLAPDHAIVAVDGSHIDVDRNSPVSCYLINTGYVSLRYGELPGADLWNEPTLVVDDEELSLRDANGLREQPIEGQVLGMLRAVMEVEALVPLVRAVPEELPVLALLDGSLILWGLTGGAYPDFVRDYLLSDRLLPALDELRELASHRTLSVASHVSLPRSTDVVNALRISQGACQWDTLNCDGNCGALRRGDRNCNILTGATDADLFDALLRPGERSPTFRTTSSVSEQHYADHKVRFFYVHLGEEIARVELPEWSAQGDALALAHAGLVAQAEKGHGYPLALQEAHEQAVINGADREYFAQLVEETLADEHLPSRTSQKARSKRTRWV